MDFLILASEHCHVETEKSLNGNSPAQVIDMSESAANNASYCYSFPSPTNCNEREESGKLLAELQGSQDRRFKASICLFVFPSASVDHDEGNR